MAPRPLPVSFYARDTVGVARDLLGCMLVTRTRGVVTAGRIVEVEAYVGPHDPAAHGFGNRRSARNAQLFGRPGTAYVYFIYGMYWCVNAVTMAKDYPAAVLIRALEPLAGLEAMRRRRGTRELRRLCSGPGKLCEALGITGRLNGARLDGRRIGIYPPEWWEQDTAPHRIVTTPRIGIAKAATWPLRFVIARSPWSSRPAPARGRRARGPSA